VIASDSDQLLHAVAWSVYLAVCRPATFVSPAKIVYLIEMSFGWLSGMDQGTIITWGLRSDEFIRRCEG